MRNIILTYVGQAGFIITSSEGKKLAIDLYLSKCVERIEGNRGFKRLLPQCYQADSLILDYIIATHPHGDHYDVDSMGTLMANGKTRLFASVNCESLVEENGINKDFVTYVKPGDTAIVDGFEIEFTECDHGIGALDAVGVIICVDGAKLYFTGDTCLRMDRVEGLKSKGPFLVISGPINGMYGNMNEKEFSVFATSIGATYIIPCHYGMFASHKGLPGVFLDEMSAIGAENGYLMTMCEDLEL